MSAPRKPHPIESLPFVEDRVPKSQTDIRRCFWNVQPTGDYGEDCRTGSRFAIEYLRYQVSFDSSGHLSLIMRDMPRETTGIEIGFLSIIDIAAKSGLAQAEGVIAYWDRAKIKSTHGALVNQRPDGSVVIEQPDGKRVVYRPEPGEAA